MINLRKPTESDIARFKECLAAEPSHKGQDPEAWTKNEFMTFYDDKGGRVWVSLETSLKIHFQHDQAVPRKQMVSLIYKGMAWVLGAARNKGFTEVLFESTEPKLIAFCSKLFGFKPVKDTYHVRTIGTTEPARG